MICDGVMSMGTWRNVLIIDCVSINEVLLLKKSQLSQLLMLIYFSYFHLRWSC